MQYNKNGFRHESLQDRKSIQQILRAIQQGVARGRLQFEDEEGQIELHPEGLLHLKVSAVTEGNENRLNIRLKWQNDGQKATKKNLKVKG